MRQNSRLTIFAAAYCDIILLDSLLRMRDHFSSGILKSWNAVPVWLCFAAAVWLFNAGFLKKERSMTAVAVWNLLIGIPECLVLYRFRMPLEGMWAHLFFLTAVAAVHARIVNRFFEPVSIDSSIRFFEMSVVEYLILIAYQSFTPLGAGLGPLLISSILVSLAAVIRGRTEGAGNADERAGKRGLAVAGGLLAAAAAGCVLFALFFSDKAGNLIAGITGLVLRAVRAAGSLLGRFLTWLLSLFPEQEYQAVELPPPAAGVDVEIPEAAELSTVWVRYLGIAAAVLMMGLLILILYRLRKVKAGRLRTGSVITASARGGLDLKNMIRGFIYGIVKSLKDRFHLMKIRDTVPGIVLAIEKSLKGSRLEKKNNESYSAFLRRIADEAETAEQKASLKKLALDFESEFYEGREPAVYSASEAADLRKSARIRA